MFKNKKITKFLVPGRRVHLVGIGGVSMRPLGLVLKGMGMIVTGSDMSASAGADCDHIAHVNTQLPYALAVAGVTFVGYILAGFVQSAWIVLPVSLAMMAAVLLVIRRMQNKKAA